MIRDVTLLVDEFRILAYSEPFTEFREDQHEIDVTRKERSS
jgi:hypothetical protein